MSTGSNIVLNDAQATPVSHIFAWDGNDKDGVSNWEDRALGTPIGYNKITVTLTPPKRGRRIGNQPVQANGNYRARVQIHTPLLETVTNATVSGIAPAPTLSYKPLVDCVFVLPERSQLIDRKNLLKYLIGALGVAQIQNVVWDLDLPR